MRGVVSVSYILHVRVTPTKHFAETLKCERGFPDVDVHVVPSLGIQGQVSTAPCRHPASGSDPLPSQLR